MNKKLKKILFILLTITISIAITYFGTYFYMKAEATANLKELINKFPDDYYIPIAKEYIEYGNTYNFDYSFIYDKTEENTMYLKPRFYSDNEYLTTEEKIYNHLDLTTEEKELLTSDERGDNASVSIEFDVFNKMLILTDEQGNYYSKKITITLPEIGDEEFDNVRNITKNFTYEQITIEDAINDEKNNIKIDYDQKLTDSLPDGYSFKIYDRIGGIGEIGGSYFIYKGDVVEYIVNDPGGLITYDRKIYIDSNTAEEDYDTAAKVYLSSLIDYEKYPNTVIRISGEENKYYEVVFNDLQSCWTDEENGETCEGLAFMFDQFAFTNEENIMNLVDEIELKANMVIPIYDTFYKNRYDAKKLYDNSNELLSLVDKNTDLDVELPEGYTLEKKIFKSTTEEDKNFYCNIYEEGNIYYSEEEKNSCLETYYLDEESEMPSILEETLPSEENYIWIKDDNKYKYLGSEFSFDVEVNIESGICAYEFDLEYDEDYFELISGNAHVADIANNSGVKTKTYTYIFKPIKISLLNDEYEFKIKNASGINYNEKTISFEIIDSKVKLQTAESGYVDYWYSQNELEYLSNNNDYHIYYILKHGDKVIYMKDIYQKVYPLVNNDETLWEELDEEYNDNKTIDLDFDTSIKNEYSCAEIDYDYINDPEGENKTEHNECMYNKTLESVKAKIDSSLYLYKNEQGGGNCYPSNMTRTADLVKKVGNKYYNLGIMTINSTNVLKVDNNDLVSSASSKLKTLLNDQSINVSLKSSCSEEETCYTCGNYIVSGDKLNTLINVVNSNNLVNLINVDSEELTIDLAKTNIFEFKYDKDGTIRYSLGDDSSDLTFNNNVMNASEESNHYVYINQIIDDKSYLVKMIKVNVVNTSNNIINKYLDRVNTNLEVPFSSENSSLLELYIPTLINDENGLLDDNINYSISDNRLTISYIDSLNVSYSKYKDLTITYTNDVLEDKTIVDSEFSNKTISLTLKDYYSLLDYLNYSDNNIILSKQIFSMINEFKNNDFNYLPSLVITKSDTNIFSYKFNLLIGKNNHYYKNIECLVNISKEITISYTSRSNEEIINGIKSTLSNELNINSSDIEVTYVSDFDNSLGKYNVTIGEKEIDNLIVYRETKTITNIDITNGETYINYEETPTVNLNVNITPSDAIYETLTYSSSDTSVATVNDSGLVTFLAMGNVTITISNNSVSKSITFEVVNTTAKELDDALKNIKSTSTNKYSQDLIDNYYKDIIKKENGEINVESSTIVYSLNDNVVTIKLSKNSVTRSKNVTILKVNQIPSEVDNIETSTFDLNYVESLDISNDALINKINNYINNSNIVAEYFVKVELTTSLEQKIGVQVFLKSNDEYYKVLTYSFNKNNIIEVPYNIRSESDLNTYLNTIFGEEVTISKNTNISYDFTQENMGVYTVNDKLNLAINRVENHITNLDITNNETVLFDSSNNTQQLNVSITPSDAIYEPLTYTSSDTSIATVNAAGLITFLKKGNVTITVKNNSVTDSITFNVTNVDSLKLVEYNEDDNSLYLFEDGILYISDDGIIKPFETNVTNIVQNDYRYKYFISNNNLYRKYHYEEYDEDDEENEKELVLSNVKKAFKNYALTNDGKIYYFAQYEDTENLGFTNIKDFQYYYGTILALSNDNKLYVKGDNIFGEKINGGADIDTPLMLLENVKDYGYNYALTYDNTLYLWNSEATSIYEFPEKVTEVFGYSISSYNVIKYYKNINNEYKYLNFYVDDKTIVIRDNDYQINNIKKVLYNNGDDYFNYYNSNSNYLLYIDNENNLRDYEGIKIASNVKDCGKIYFDGDTVVYLTNDNKLYGFGSTYNDEDDKIYNSYLIMDHVRKITNGAIQKEDYTILNSGYNYDKQLGVNISDEYVKYPAKVVKSKTENIEATDMFIYEETKKEISVDDKLDILGIVLPYNASNKTVKYSVDNTELASMNTFGLLTAKKKGTVKVTVSNYNNTANYSIDVNIHDKANDVELYYHKYNSKSDSYEYYKLSDSIDKDVVHKYDDIYFKILPTDSLNKSFTLTSSDENILAFNSNDISCSSEYCSTYISKIEPGNVTLTFTFETGNVVTKNLTIYETISEPPSSPYIYISSSSEDGINIMWSKVDKATSYEIYRSTSKKGTYTKIATTSNNKYNDDSITNGVIYFYKVKAVNDKGSSEYSNICYDSVELEYPCLEVGSTGYNYILLNWNQVEDATGYILYRSTSLNGTYSKIATIKNPNISYKNTSLSFNKNYYYKIRSYKIVNGNNSYSNYSEVLEVKTELESPTLVVNKYTSNSLKLTWNKVSGASGYLVYKCDDLYESCTSYKATTTNYLIINKLNLGETYYYAIKAYKTVSKKKYYSDVNYADGIVSPSMPNASINVSDNNNVILSWDNVSGVNKYLIEYKDKTSDEWISHETTDESYEINDLEIGHTYIFRVISVYQELESIPKSIEYTFIPETPSNVSAKMQSYGNLLINFDDIDNASYAIYRSTSKTSGFKKITTVDNSEYVDTNVNINTTYYYKVRSIVNGVYSKYSSVVAAKSYLVKPTYSVSNNSYNSLKININSVSGASGYEIYRSTNKSKNYKKVKTTSSLEYIDSSLSFNKTYYYKIRAYKKIGKKVYYSSYSSILYNKTILSAPVVTLENNVLSWNSVVGANNYQIYKCDSDSCSLLTSTKELTYDISLLSEEDYTYKVRSVRVVSNKNYYSYFSNNVSFNE